MSQADHQLLKTFARTPLMTATRSFRYSMGLAYWVPAVVVFVAAGFMGWYSWDGAPLAGSIASASSTLVAAGVVWWGRAISFGYRSRRHLLDLVDLTPWGVLRFHASGVVEVEQIDLLRRYIVDDARLRWSFDVTILLLSLEALVESQLDRIDNAGEAR
ncbi:MAG: hypothetical protein RJQ08_10620 [Salinisphaeraceae bacterium]